MYSFTRSLIGVKLARMLIHESVVVSTTSTSERPSTPTLYWIPKAGIQSACSMNSKPPPARPGRKPTRSSRLNTQARPAAARATRRARSGRSRGVNATAIAPTRGRKITTERIGKPPMSIASPVSGRL